jgi:hypothetical protein
VNKVKLVVMNACQSASFIGSTSANFARQLASHGIPYVLGMTFSITDIAVKNFISALHDNLLWNSRNILLAVHSARSRLRANTERVSHLFGLPISLQDDILPVLYASGRQLHKHSLTSLLTTHLETPIETSTYSDGLFGRGLDMLKVQNQLIRNRVCVVHGPHGVGKRCLIDNLGKWFLESRLVEHILHLDCSSGISSLDSVLAIIRRQIMTTAGVNWLEDHDSQDAILEALASHSTLLTVRNVGKDEHWLAELCSRLSLVEVPSESLSLFVLISSTTPLESIRLDITGTGSSSRFAYELSGLSPISAMDLARSLQDSRQLEKEPYSALWYRQRTLSLLQYHPLALKIFIPAATDRDPDEVYWNLKSGKLDLNWEKTGIKELCLRWRHLTERHLSLLQALIPFTTSMPEDYLAKVPTIAQAALSARQTLIEAGCAYETTSRSLQFHPLFVHFTRSQPWTEADIKSSWHRAAVYYQGRSIDWIRTGLSSPSTQRSQPKDEWENLTAVLYHLAPMLNTDSEASSLFDLSWIVSSFHAFHNDMPRHAVDMFADLTLKALNAMVPRLVPTTNEVLRMVVDECLRIRARSLSDFQILRATLLVQFLVQYYYDISPKTANIYQNYLLILQDPIRDGLGDRDFAGLFEMAKTISSLTNRGFALELGLQMDTMENLSNLSSEMNISSDFQSFASIWDRTHILRFIGYHIDPVATYQNQMPRSEVC